MEMHTYRAHNRLDSDPPPPPPPGGRIYEPGHLVAISSGQATSALGKDTGLFGPGGIFTFTGRDGLPRSITGDYALGSIPGGHTGTKTFPGKGALDQNLTGPVVTQDLTGAVLVKGIVQKYPWAELEPTKDPGDGSAYDFSRLIADAAMCAGVGTRLIPMITVRTFNDADQPAPAYLNKLPYNINVANVAVGWQMARWDAFVHGRYGLMVDRIGNILDGFSGYYGIATQETSCGLSKTNGPGGGFVGSEQDLVNYNATTYLAALKDEGLQINGAGTRQRHFGYHNYIPNDNFGGGGNGDMESYVRYLPTIGSITGGPDLLPDSSLNPGVYNDYVILAGLPHATGNGPSFIAAQPHTFAVCNGTDLSWNGGVARTIQEMFNFSTNRNGAITSKILHLPDVGASNMLGMFCDFVVWDWHQGGSQDFEAAVMAVIKANPTFHWWNPP